MANTYTQIYIQTVFVVKYRAAVIDPSWKPQLCGLIGNLINEEGNKTIIVNGVSDHIHCFFGLKPTEAISDIMRVVKSKSSKWINENHLTHSRFEWQEGYGAFSYAHSQLNSVYKYFENQEARHEKVSFQKEYLDFLKKFEVPYDERYIFEELV